MTKDRRLDELCINTIRFLAVDAVEKARSGHPGAPLGAAPMAYVLWDRHLRHNPANPRWPDRDRFVLSMGHASMLLYALLYMFGYPMTLDEIKRFRQWGSKTPGHPEYDPELGVETTTGPLGQGFGNAVGMAIAEAYLGTLFNRDGHTVVNHYTYVLASDGDIMEGVNHEVAALAGHLRLGKLIVLYDDNHITIDGPTDLAFTEDVAKRYEGYGWHVQRVEDGNDIEAIDAAIRAAKAETQRPSLIMVRTHIGYGSPRQDSPKAHGEPLGADNVRATKEYFGWPLEPEFYVPEAALAHTREAVERGKQLEREWQKNFKAWSQKFPELVELWNRVWNRALPPGIDERLPTFTELTPLATRAASGKVINAIAPIMPELIGGSADLAGSNKTKIESADPFQAGRYHGRNLFFGVREHGMGAILNGILLHGGLRAYGGTFLIFSDYMRPTIRLAALMHQPVIYVFTHDSIGLGEDGPTHQPVEQLPSLRTIPGLWVIRPADANETAAAWKLALERTDGPVALALTRQKIPTLESDRETVFEGVARGAYILDEASTGKPDIILIATGSEVHLVREARQQLEKEGFPTRVVSMPCWELFEAQDPAYRDRVLPPDVPVRIAVEAAATLGWCRWVGDTGAVIGLDRFGASAPYPEVMEKLGFSVERIVNTAKAVFQRIKRPTLAPDS